MNSAAEELKEEGYVPHAAFVTDPCDGRCQGTVGMFDSLPYRNDAAMVMRRLMRSLPTRRAVIGVATCDKGLPAMMMALAGMHDTPVILIPGGATLSPIDSEDLGTVQTLGVRYAMMKLLLTMHGERDAAPVPRRAAAVSSLARRGHHRWSERDLDSR
ncbi:dihydroxy-acid dehydratase domain-containing protein [Selenomonas sp. oral taxon 136]|uniref:dihydroxy-acid dehydratase domain-containing protein n=1 Tax=Selenomonas sp. oral taxon 136 TaxID=713030 RepID=UPI0022B2687F|nr:dihydroxy-acid dehydratase [Selenomonas sp. oral taxon 136]